jgi:hypothetical protein
MSKRPAKAVFFVFEIGDPVAEAKKAAVQFRQNLS